MVRPGLGRGVWGCRYCFSPPRPLAGGVVGGYVRWVGGRYGPSPNPSRKREGLNEARQADPRQRRAHRAVDDAQMRLNLAASLEAAIVGYPVAARGARDRTFDQIAKETCRNSRGH